MQSTRFSARPGVPQEERPPSAEPRAERGAVLVWALLFSIITSAMIVSHATYMAANRREMHVRYEHATLADQFARSGLTDTLTWFQRQVTQPVTAFQPKLDPNGDPPMVETLDPTVGLVREFEVRGNLWARYEVRSAEAQDVSSQRGQTTAGTVWDVGSRSYLYYLNDPDAPFDAGPNRVMATTYLRAEMQGIPLVPPAGAAIAVDSPDRINIGPKAEIDGGEGPAVAAPDTVSMPPGLAAQLTGMPPVLSVPGYRSSPEDVFSMHFDSLRGLSDFVVEEASVAAAVSTATALPMPAGGSGGDGGFGLPALGLGGLMPPPLGLGGEPMSVTSSLSSPSVSAELVGTLVSGSRPEPWWFESMMGWWGQKWQESQASRRAASSMASTPTRVRGWSWLHRRFQAGRGQVLAAVVNEPTLQDRAIFVDHDVQLDGQHPMTGRVLLVVDGDLTVHNQAEIYIQGMVYVRGDCVIKGDFHLDGMLVVRGSLDVGFGTGSVKIRRDQHQLDALKRSLERYRMSRSIRPGWAAP